MTIRVIYHSLGGSYRKDAELFIRPIAEDNLKYFQIETCFIRTASFNEKGIFSA